MDTGKKHYFLKLNPPRPSFAMDMDDEEKSIMKKHSDYWASLLREGVAVVYGPVFDPKGVYGVGIVSVKNENQLNHLIANDPSNGLNRFEFYEMIATYSTS
jgi:uncharacterized protein